MPYSVSTPMIRRTLCRQQGLYVAVCESSEAASLRPSLKNCHFQVGGDQGAGLTRKRRHCGLHRGLQRVAGFGTTCTILHFFGFATDDSTSFLIEDRTVIHDSIETVSLLAGADFDDEDLDLERFHFVCEGCRNQLGVLVCQTSDTP